jgi:prepilin-type N-terminal cleavage/methylation domain-containing protein
MGKRGFTLLEIIVVLIIIGIVATLGLTQYTQVVEKGRTAEAKSNLGTIRTLAIAQQQEYGNYNLVLTNYNLPATCNSTYYYSYSINTTTGMGTATRCTGAAGKQPGGPSAYTLTLTVDGVLTSPY